MVLFFLVVLERGVYMSKLHIMSVDNNILKTHVLPNTVLALFTDSTGKINVGYPGIAAYKPILGNMWGYKEAVEDNIKGLYIIVPEDYKDLNEQIYSIEIDEDRNIVTSMELVEQNKIVDSNCNVISFANIRQKRKVLK
jgi:hypothetical protein